MIGKGKTLNKDTVILIILILLTLWVRLSTQMMIHTGVDERDYWFSAKTISQGLEYPTLTHRTVRWGIILPVALIQKVCGVHPNVNYLAPLLNALIQIALLYMFGKMIQNRFVGVLACFFLIFFPYQIKAASQVCPEIFSITYILLCVFFFMKYMESAEKKSVVYLILSSLTMFVAYETKITNLFFMPGILLSVFIFKREHWVRDCFIFGGILLVLFLLETGLYALFTDYSLGHLSIIKANHLTDMADDATEPLRGFLDVFKRYSPANLQLYWLIPFAVFALVSVFFLVKKRDRRLSVLILISFGFFFCITFSFTSLKPLMLAEYFINRYFCAVLPFVFVVIACFIDTRIGHPSRFSAKALGIFTGTVMLGTSVLFALPFVPESRKYILHSPFTWKDHPFYVTAAYNKILNAAWLEGTPVVAAEGNGGTNTALTVCLIFIDTKYYVDGAPPSRRTVTVGDTRVNIVSRTGKIENGNCIAVVRNPFRIGIIPVAKLAALEIEKIPVNP